MRGVDRPVIFTRFLGGPTQTLMWNWSPVIAPPVCCCRPGFRGAYRDAEGGLECTAVIDELAPLPGEPQVEKYGYNAFHRTNLTDILRAHGSDTVVVTGRVTQICVEDTARGAFYEGFQTIVVADAVSSFDAELHRNTLRNVEMKHGRVLTTDDVLPEIVAPAPGLAASA